MLGLDNPNDDAAASHKPWTRIALPDGQIGYVAPGRLISLAAARLCYAKDMAGRWRIAGIISAGPGPTPDQ
jgi:hypothetical protein